MIECRFETFAYGMTAIAFCFGVLVGTFGAALYFVS